MLDSMPILSSMATMVQLPEDTDTRPDTRTGSFIWAWSGPVFAVVFGIGFVVLAGFVPPPAPDAGAREISAFFTEHADGIRAGMLICGFAIILLVAWGIALAVEMMRAQPGRPLFSYTQMICLGMGTLTGILDITVWAVAAYRPTELAPDTTRMLNDLGWFLFLFTASPFCLWLVSAGFAVLFDRRERPDFPRWTGYLSFWMAFCVAPGALIVFFKHGPFGWAGLIAFYVPLIAFFIWFAVMHVYLLRAIRSRPAD